MASITKVKRKAKNGRAQQSYKVRWRDPEGRPQAKTFRTAEEARACAVKVEADKNRGEYVDPRSGRTSVAAAARKMIEDKAGALQPKTVAGYWSIWRAHIEGTKERPSWIGRRSLASVRTSDINRLLSEKAREGLRNDTRRQIRQLLYATFEAAVADRAIGRNPVTPSTKIPKGPKREVVPMTPQEIEDAVDELDDRYRAYVYTMAALGPRWGEASSRRIKHYDRETGKLEIPDAVSEVGGHLLTGDTKTHQKRTINLSPFLRELLNDHIDKFVPDADNPEALIFTTPRGTPLRGSNWRERVWYPALEAAGVPKRQIRDLRNTAISVALANGATPTAVAAMVGHAKESMTLDVYRRMTPGEDERLTRVIEDNWKPRPRDN